ncbi:MAG: imidazole glycerol phosphate synthase subunit HisH, partial [Candidatus Thiodiazotropha sp.]
MTQRITVIDYGMGNLRSVAKAVEHVAAGNDEVLVTDDPELILASDRVVFPGQG